MTDNVTRPSIPWVLIAGALIALSTHSTLAQSGHRIEVPKAFLDVLDKEDRDCVVNNGGASRNVHVTRVALTGTSQQFLVRGSGLCLCGAQNCGFWIYQKVAGTYQLILKGIGATSVKPGNGSAKGYRDVVSESHASAIETIMRTYRYNGSQYQIQRCLRRVYYDEKGNESKKPSYLPCQ